MKVPPHKIQSFPENYTVIIVFCAVMMASVRSWLPLTALADCKEKVWMPKHICSETLWLKDNWESLLAVQKT